MEIHVNIQKGGRFSCKNRMVNRIFDWTIIIILSQIASHLYQPSYRNCCCVVVLYALYIHSLYCSFLYHLYIVFICRKRPPLPHSLLRMNHESQMNVWKKVAPVCVCEILQSWACTYVVEVKSPSYLISYHRKKLSPFYSSRRSSLLIISHPIIWAEGIKSWDSDICRVTHMTTYSLI